MILSYEDANWILLGIAALLGLAMVVNHGFLLISRWQKRRDEE